MTMKNIMPEGKRRKVTMIGAGAVLALAIVLGYFGSRLAKPGDFNPRHTDSLYHVELPDTLRVGMLNSPTTYFDYRGTPMGYDYEMMERFAKSRGVQVKVEVGGTISEMLDWLNEGKVDVVASPVPMTSEFQDRVLLCGPKMVSNQVLVQKGGETVLTDVTQLVGHEVDVQADSKYYYRLKNLNEELGGGIEIKALERDTITDDDLLEMVWKGELPMTVVDSDVAEAALSYYPGLDISLKVSMDQYSRWAVAPGAKGLAEVLDKWFSDKKDDTEELYKKYYRLSKTSSAIDLREDNMLDLKTLKFAAGKISPYDELFKQAAKGSGFDWRLIAALAYVESRFNPELRSWAGATGIMQVMPHTARAMGYNPAQLRNPSVSIGAAVKLLQELEKQFATKIPDKNERMKFIIASYNSGHGHILDAIALAGKYGMDPKVWEGNVEKAALLKSKPAYYRDPVVKNGYFRGKETVDFVKRVNDAYALFCEKTS